jgi:hypothetical protein
MARLSDELVPVFTEDQRKLLQAFVVEVEYMTRQAPSPQYFLSILRPPGLDHGIPVTSFGESHRIEDDHRLQTIVLCLRKLGHDRGVRFLDVVKVIEDVEKRHPHLTAPYGTDRMKMTWTCEGRISPKELVDWWIQGIFAHGGEDIRKNKEKFNNLCEREGTAHVHGWLAAGLHSRFYVAVTVADRLTGKLPLFVERA